MELTRRSELTGIEHTREIPASLEQLESWLDSGIHIQDYFPDLSADDREFILTGSTPEEWHKAFGEEE